MPDSLPLSFPVICDGKTCILIKVNSYLINLPHKTSLDDHGIQFGHLKYYIIYDSAHSDVGRIARYIRMDEVMLLRKGKSIQVKIVGSQEPLSQEPLSQEPLSESESELFFFFFQIFQNCKIKMLQNACFGKNILKLN